VAAERAERRAARLLGQMSEAHVAFDHDFRIVAVNPAAERALGLPADALLGRTAWEAFPATLGTEIERQYRRVQGERVEAHFAHHYVGEGYDFHVEIDAYPTEDDGVAMFWRDVTERLRGVEERERLLGENEAARARMGRVLAQTPAAVAVLLGPDHVVQSTNEMFLRLFGRRDYVGRPAREGAPELESQGFLARMDEVYRTGVAYEGREAVLRWDRDGDGVLREGYFDFVYQPILDAAGAVEGILVFAIDVTEQVRSRRQVERASRRTEQLQALTAALAGARTLDDVTAVVVASAAEAAGAVSGALAMRIPGTDEAVLCGTRGLDDAIAERFPRFPLSGPNPAARCLRTGEPQWLSDVTALRASFPELREVWARMGTQAIATVPLLVDGLTLGAMSFTFDVPMSLAAADRAFFLALAHQVGLALERTRLLEAEHAARAQAEAAEARLRDVVEQAPLAVAVLEGPEHVYTLVSPMYAASPGGGRPLLGRPVREAFPEVEGTGYFETMDGVFRTGEPFFARERSVFLSRGGAEPEERFFNVGYQPLRDAAGQVYAIASVSYDVTEHVMARREIEVAREAAEAARAEAEAANRSKSEFLAVMSHELRTPLNAIAGYAELLAMGIRGPITEQQADDLRRIQTSQRHLLGLINEVLNYARLETGSVQYDLADVSVRDALAASEALVAPQARAKGLSLTVHDVAPALAVRADAEKLRQVLVNLLSNAVKFTDRGGAVTLDAEADDRLVRIRVHDTGIGIASDKRAVIFEPFVQVRADLTRTAEGTGLGLAISRDLARGMGGELVVERSAPGAGTTLLLTLPLAPAADAASA
jgi:PAS domain S-box-containing protein